MQTNEDLASAGRLSAEVLGPEAWLAGARFISEMLVLADIVDPVVHLAIPFVGHCFYIAECCFLRGMSPRL